MRPLLYLIILTLAACTKPVITDSPAFTQYTAEQQKQMEADYKALPQDSTMRIVVRDCRALRKEIRAGKQL